jgi:hypothetical protein
MTRVRVLLPVFIALLGAGAAAREPQVAGAGVQAAAPDVTTPPRIPVSGKTVEAFVPPGYEIFDRKEADFDGDGRIDVVLGLQVAHETGWYENPRLLVILFRKPDGSYRLSAQSDGAIPDVPPGGHDYGIGVKGRSIELTAAGFSKAGAGAEHTDIYRFQSGGWYLIGTVDRRWNREDGRVDCEGVTLEPGETCVDRTTSTNLNTSVVEVRAEVVHGNPDDSDAPTRTVTWRHPIPKAALKRLEDVVSEP